MTLTEIPFIGTILGLPRRLWRVFAKPPVLVFEESRFQPSSIGSWDAWAPSGLHFAEIGVVNKQRWQPLKRLPPRDTGLNCQARIEHWRFPGPNSQTPTVAEGLWAKNPDTWTSRIRRDDYESRVDIPADGRPTVLRVALRLGVNAAPWSKEWFDKDGQLVCDKDGRVLVPREPWRLETATHTFKITLRGNNFREQSALYQLRFDPSDEATEFNLTGPYPVGKQDHARFTDEWLAKWGDQS